MLSVGTPCRYISQCKRAQFAYISAPVRASSSDATSYPFSPCGLVPHILCGRHSAPNNSHKPSLSLRCGRKARKSRPIALTGGGAVTDHSGDITDMVPLACGPPCYNAAMGQTFGNHEQPFQTQRRPSFLCAFLPCKFGPEVQVSPTESYRECRRCGETLVFACL